MDRTAEPKLTKRVRYLFLLIAICFYISGYAQSAIDISGSVVDSEGVPIAGAGVIVQGETRGTLTDNDGVYHISNVMPGSVLEFTMIGFNPEERTIGDKKIIDVILKESSYRLDDVVVIGYGSLSRKELSSSIVSISKDDFVKGAVGSAMELVAGKIAGLNVNTTAAANPNSTPSLQIRGATSISASNDPLIVIDGIPGGDLRNLSPQDIESITVLKDGASSAIYGTRGANGVILVTTNRNIGTDSRCNVRYESWAGINLETRKPEVLTPDEYRRSMRGTDYGHSTDWYDAIFRNVSYDINQYISLYGGTSNSYYNASLNYRNSTGLDIATKREEYGGRFTFNQKAINGLMEISASLSPRHVKETYGDDTQFYNALTSNPTMPIYNEDGSFYHPTFPSNAVNPVEELTDRTRGAERTFMLANTELKMNIVRNERHNLTTKLTYSLEYNDSKSHDYLPSTTSEAIEAGYRGKAEVQYQKWWNNSLEWVTNYMFVPNINHNFQAVAGYSYQDFNYENQQMANMDFAYDSFLWHNMGSGSYLSEGKASMATGKTLSKLIGVFGRVNYNWRQLIMLSASLRYEGSTKFGKNSKWGFFPAASVAWEIANMGFMDKMPWAESLKLRVSYGVTGRSDIGSYQSLSTYAAAGEYFIDGAWVTGYGPNINPNPNLRWEKAIVTNLGVDFSFFKGRLSGTIEYFNRVSKDLLYSYAAPQPPMIYESILVNVGSTLNQGFELALNGDIVKSGKFRWNIGMTYSYGTTRLTRLSNEFYKATYLDLYKKPGVGTEEYLFRLEEGGLIGSFYGYEYGGFTPEGDMLIINKDGDRVKKGAEKLEDKKYIGNGAPKHYYSLQSNFQYGNFDLSIMFRGAAGFDIMNWRLYSMGLQMSGSQNVLRTAYTDFVRVTKDANILSSFYLERGDYLRIENITLGYTLPFAGNRDKNIVDMLRVFVSVKTPYTFTAYTGADPSTVYVNGLTPGVDSGSIYPSSMQCSLGVTLSFK